jgi:DNA (cytosine-5)-methyltransferase 1
MKYGSVCSGIEAASVAWHPLGWEPQWFSEIESFPSEVLKQRFPDVPNLGDMTQLTSNPTFNEKSIDLLVGGTPCQSFSVAGLRGGLADPRGNLMLTFLGLADAKKPKWIVWENVPGVLSSNGGKDFGTFLGALAELGYGFAYRVLDAQHFGVAQRRRRVFVVGYLGDWRPAAAVLFESESLQRNPKPSRAKREEAPTYAQGGSRTTSPDGRETIGTLRQRDYKGIGNDDLESGRGLAIEIKDVDQPQYFENHPNDSRVTGPHDVGNTVSARYGTGGGNTPIVSQPIAVDWRTTQVDVEMTGTLKTDLAKMSGPCVTVDCYNQTINEKTTQTIGSSASDINHIGGVLQTMAIRRLTPRECERLQGFPDDWTKIHYHKNGKSKECPDGPRYKACGNSMAVPVMRWIGERIQMVERLAEENRKNQ